MLYLIYSGSAFGNGVQFSNLNWINTSQLELEVSWENSWNLSSGVANHDALWIFAKYRSTTSDWQHLDLLQADAEGSFEAEVSSDNKGIWLKPELDFVGNTGTIKLEIELAEIADLDRVRFFAVEMVYVPQSSFYVGDAASVNHLTDVNGQPYQINSEDLIPVGSTGMDSAGLWAPKQNIPEHFPKGYNAFYLMKHELSQSAYVSFLNTLSSAEQENRIINYSGWSFDPSDLHRNGIFKNPSASTENAFVCDGNRNGIFNEADDGQDWAMNGLSWDDLAAWLDWAALRPITELEFEKACRGPVYPIPGEFAWGSDQIVDANTITDSGYPNESVSETVNGLEGLASHGYLGPQGPLRCGFAGTENSSRFSSGASYYGILEMSGNLWELCVKVNSSDLSFDGQSADGILSGAWADEGNWPDAESVVVRGGAWNSGIGPIGNFRDLAVSDRWYFDLIPDVRRFTVGGRGARNPEP